MNIDNYLQHLAQTFINQGNKKSNLNQLKTTFKAIMHGDSDSQATELVVKAGDTVSQLALDNHTTIASIVQANHLNDPNLILVGQRLSMPTGIGTAASAPNSVVVNTSNTEPLVNTIQNQGQTSIGQAVAQYAQKFMGNVYVWGSAQPGAFDCSGLVTYAYQQFGINLPHLAQAQADQTQHIPTAQAKAGDLLFWQNKSGHVYHVAIALGDGRYINALDPQSGVRIGGMAAPADFAGRIK